MCKMKLQNNKNKEKNPTNSTKRGVYDEHEVGHRHSNNKVNII